MKYMFNVKVVKATIWRKHLLFVVAIADLQMFREKLYIFCGAEGGGLPRWKIARFKMLIVYV